MAPTMVSHSLNGAKPANGTRPAPRPLAPGIALGQKIDHLAELRTLIRLAQDEERKLTAEGLGALQAASVTQRAGQQAVATVSERTTLKPDAELFVQALGTRAYPALAVKVEEARRLMATDDLAAISETTTTPILTIRPLNGGAA